MYKGITVEKAIQAIEDDYTILANSLTHGGQDGAKIIDYTIKILKGHQRHIRGKGYQKRKEKTYCLSQQYDRKIDEQ